ncbi:MAG: right-handed parallel beta-helix repeat-containing protein, partial [Oceanobacter sp.]
MTAQRWIRILLSALVLLASAARTWAVCDDIRWDETERQFSVYGDGDVCTLQDILDEYPDTDALIKVDGDEGIWFLDADLLIRTGATLQLHGADADGTTNRLYFSSSDGNYHAIDASWGILSIQSTEIFGWDMSSGDISDVEGTGEYHRYYDDGRSYIKARSRLDDSGPNDVSTLIVKTSELAYLGFNKGESYGLSASVEDSADCSTTALRVYAVIQGNQIHHTYRGFSGLCLTSETSMVTGNEISDVAEDAVHLANNINYVVVNSNYIDASGDVAVSCGDSCNYLTVSNNILSNNEVAIELDSDVENATVSDNTIRYSREKGIELRDVEDSSISSNQIFCTGGSEGTACGSVLYEGTASGIHIISSYNNQVDENSIV